MQSFRWSKSKRLIAVIENIFCWAVMAIVFNLSSIAEMGGADFVLQNIGTFSLMIFLPALMLEAVLLAFPFGRSISVTGNHIELKRGLRSATRFIDVHDSVNIRQGKFYPDAVMLTLKDDCLQFFLAWFARKDRERVIELLKSYMPAAKAGSAI